MSWTDKATTDEKITALKTDIAALESSIAGNIDVQSYQIGGKNLSRYTLEEKTNLHTWLEKKLNKLIKTKSIEDGNGNINQIKYQF